MKKKRKNQTWLSVEIMRCQRCPAMTVVLGNEHGGMRLSGHKCAGGWDRLQGFHVPTDALLRDVLQCISEYAFKRKDEA
jgi:hypothetical protein